MHYWINKIPHQLPADLAQQREALTNVTKLTGFGQGGMQLLEGVAPSLATLRRYLGLQKVKSVIDLVNDEFQSGLEKIVIFAIHQAVIEELRVGLRRHGAVTLYGGTAPATRERNIKKFQTDLRCKVFIGNIMAAGVGINLTAAHQVLFVEQDWVPANNAQAAMRVHRIGQTKPVSVRIAMLDGDELDRKVQMALRRKTVDLVAAFD